MIRFTCFQHRTQAAVALGVLAILAIVLAVTGIQVAHAYDATVAACRQRGDCAAALSAFPYTVDPQWQWGLLNALVIAAPGIIGMFWGAPLAAREFETGTFRLAWTQGITRARWLAVKLAVGGAASMATAGLLSLMVTWWCSPIDTATMNRLSLGSFPAGGVAPVGYAAFAFTLGLAAGVLIRRTVPAMAVTVVIFAAVQLAFPGWVRPHLIAPVQASPALRTASIQEAGSTNSSSPGGYLFVRAQSDAPPGAWVLSSQILTPAGRPASTEPASACGSQSQLNARNECIGYIASLHLRQAMTYQPISRYWPLQWIETAVYLGLALFLAGLCYLRIIPRRSARPDIHRPRAIHPAPALERSP
jgi:ABC-type transport system involved in multi-copper enzyme maturation permease subunit